MAADEVLERRLARRRAGTIEEPGTEYTLLESSSVCYSHTRGVLYTATLTVLLVCGLLGFDGVCVVMVL